MQPVNPFEIAKLAAHKERVCPVNKLDAFYTNHWDFESLCSKFKCERCVATLEDIGYGSVTKGGELSPDFKIEKEWELAL